jgi:hypothetical protein
MKFNEVLSSPKLKHTLETPKRTLFLSGAGGWGRSFSQWGRSFSQVETDTNKVNLRGALFAAGAEDTYHEYAIAMPENWDGGTIVARPIFMTEGTGTGTIVFGVQGRCYASTDATDQAFGTAQESSYNATGSIADKVMIGAWTPEITLAGAGAWCQIRVYRDGDDTNAEDVILLGMLVSYGTNDFSDR